MAEDKIEKIKKIDKTLKPLEHPLVNPEENLRVKPNKEHFDDLMSTQQIDKDTAKAAVPEQIEPVTKTSLMDEMRNLNQKVNNISKISPAQLVAQADEVVNHMEEIKQKLATPNLEIKPGTQTLLENKLLHIDENLRVALSKAGVEYTPPPTHAESKLVNPIERFLGFLTNGQEQMKSLSREVEKMHLNRDKINPASMLRIQLKVGYIQQEIEFFTNVLNQALQSTKTIMNVQV